MVGKHDIQLIDTTYFDIIEAKGFFTVLRSKNTGHFWYLLERKVNGHRTFEIRHKHHAADPYHPQTNRPSIDECCTYIMDHDAFHLKRVQQKRERRLLRHSARARRSPRYFSIDIFDTDLMSSSLHRGGAYKAAASLIHPRRALDHHDEG